MQPELNFMYVHSDSIGYGRMGMEMARVLPKVGVDLYDHLPGTPREHNGERSKKCNVICWASVPTHARAWWKSQIPCMLTMWESTRLPESFRETLHEFDTVVVPSLQNVELFSNYHDNVKFVPLGIDPERWRFVSRTAPTNEFRFLIGGSGKRKGTDLAYKAFRKVFATWPKTGPVPKLIFKNPRGEEFYGDRIEMVTGRISTQAEVDLYASAHCYLQPSRGEGFGLQPLQAIAQGLPTILTNAHGHECYAHLGYGLSTSPTPSDYFIYGDAGDWWEPDFDELCERMWWVYNNYDIAVADAEVNSIEARAEYTWENTANKFLDALGRDRLSVPFKETDEWYEPEARRYLVMVNEKWRMDVAGIVYYFEPGKQYWEMADVKRILFEAGKLDPACLTNIGEGVNTEFDAGLTQSQLDRIPDYTAAHSHCPTCGQTLNSKPTRSDELMDSLVEDEAVPA